ncbi:MULTISPECIES: Hcp family type VI secretion system effector [unclassified Pseudomonas]|uniref:Hcp family type VI secretion system effector n=1 Tax=unclassified Pseudomonas TaxID=196821 RepID=UPI002AC89CFC|nr:MULTISPECIES: Hcp family type VI secretion system effector [unclassified Pseudomonas]MEB0041652.1 Hcp family type VI secretion system effector [Pseudomonas sp. MH10]MEB0079931.1 Hcp family type VI secretion system effector [Pseudomonas sp. MH10out]MEB0093359.1 Hcp family type VI secretion system effector [Pseudomonas sp. CCI4.2]MEB0104142.1 Hcp family type VI secretion system effector [Pseudomonas sp. CCI3.2]MEB0121972.1 Hcp family type VI secretion system effector [Pseudomonas sp. CCI1.2]
MPIPAYMTIHGTHQHLISAGALGADSVGNAWQQGREDQILVQAYDHGVVIPGGVAGRRMHKPLIITKAIDKSSPLLFNAATNGEALKICQLHVYRPSGSGVEHFYTIELEGAVIVAFNQTMPHCQNLSTAHFTQLETVHFAYQNIVLRHESGKTVGYDEWRSEGKQ